MTDFDNSSNHFLASLSAHDSDLLRPHLRRDDLILHSVLYDTEQHIARVYFPTAGIISLVVALSDGQMIEAGMFGRNSVVGGGGSGRQAGNQSGGRSSRRVKPQRRC